MTNLKLNKGTSMEKGEKAGKLVFFNKDNFEKVK